MEKVQEEDPVYVTILSYVKQNSATYHKGCNILEMVKFRIGGLGFKQLSNTEFREIPYWISTCLAVE
jgi:hypothetical protein